MSQTSEQPIITLTNVSWQVGVRDILTNINCSIKRGSFTGVLGPNGAGKSSLLRHIYRYLSPSSGVVTYNGTDVQQWNAKQYAQKVAVVLQHTPQDNVRKTVEYIHQNFRY